MADPLVVRAFEPGDEVGTRDLLTRVFGDAASYDRYATGNPLGDPLRIVATQGEKIVGCNIWNAWRIHASVELPVAYQSGGSAVDPDLRGQGVFGKLLDKGAEVGAERGIHYFVGFPNPASFKSFLRAGWQHVGSMDLRVAPVPALGRHHAAPSEPDGDGFAAWRYREIDALRATVETRRGRYHAYYSRSSRYGVPILKLLDIVGDDGRRDLSEFLSVCRRLPGPGAVLLRATHPTLPEYKAPTIRRPWSTPVILKRLPAGDPRVEGALITSPFFYGDIDAA